MRRSACIAMAMFLLVFAVVFTTTPAHPGDSDPLIWSIGRLWIGEHSMCTGFIVGSREIPGNYDEHDSSVRYANLVVSAGHCFDSRMEFDAHAVQIDGQWLPPYSDGMQMNGLSRSYDVMTAVFYSPWKLPALVIDTAPIGHDEPLEVIGYGGYVLGAKVFPFDTFNPPYLEIAGTIIGGYSGSPVLRTGTNHVVGVAVAQHLKPGTSFLACLLGLKCDVTPPYYAVPIKRVADLVDLSGWTAPQ